MSNVQSSAETGVLGRVITRIRSESTERRPENVERALAAKQAARMTTRALSDTGVTEESSGRTRVVSRSVSGCDESIPVDARWPYAGLAPMTRVRTSFGDVYAVALRKGDLLKTRSGEFKPIVWLDRIMLDDEFLQSMRDSNPIVLAAGSVARGLPKRDVLVSPRQVISSQSDMHQAREAGDLLGRPNVRRKYETGMSYTVFHLGRTEEILCEGMWLRLEL